MSDSSPSGQAAQRSLGGLIFAGAAVLTIAAMLVVWFGTMFFMKQGRAPEGPRTAVTLVSCAEAHPLLQARVETMGLGDPTFTAEGGQWTVTADFTGDAEVDRRIPDVLAAPGRFAVLIEGEEIVSSDQVTSIVPQVDYYANPELLLNLDLDGATALLDAMRADGTRTLQYTVDGQVVSERDAVPPIENGELQLQPGDARTRTGVQTVAEWSVTLPNGPLPCAARVSSVQVVSSPE